MKSPTFVKQGLLGLFWREESINRALFAKLLWHHKLCMHFNILERLISENFLLQSRVSHAYVTQRVSSHSDERMSSFTELCTFENHALWCTRIRFTFQDTYLPQLRLYIAHVCLYLTTQNFMHFRCKIYDFLRVVRHNNGSVRNYAINTVKIAHLCTNRQTIQVNIQSDNISNARC